MSKTLQWVVGFHVTQANRIRYPAPGGPERSEQRAGQAEAASELGVVAGELAHEIRNSFNSIRFNLFNIQDVPALLRPANSVSGDVAILVERIASQVDRLEEVVGDFLRAARPEPHIEPGHESDRLENRVAPPKVADFLVPSAQQGGGSSRTARSTPGSQT